MVMKMAEELQGEGKDGDMDGDDEVDLYDDVLSLPVGMDDIDEQEKLAKAPSPVSSTTTTTNNIERVHLSNANHNNINNQNDGQIRDRDNHEYKDSAAPQRKHQVFVGNLTWWTSDRDLEEAMDEIGVKDFVEVKFYDNKANGQSKGFCILTVGTDASVKLIHEKLSKKDLHGQFPEVTYTTKQSLNNFEAQAKSRSSPSGGQGMDAERSGGGEFGHGPGNMGMNMMGGGPRPQMQGPMGMYGGPRPRIMMGPNGPGPIHGPRGMPPMRPMGRMHGPGMMGPQYHGGPIPGPGYGPPQQPRQGQPQNMMQPGGPKMVMIPRGPMPPGMMDPRGSPAGNAWRPPNNPEFMNNYLPRGPPMSPPGPPHIRGQGNFPPPQIAGGPPPSVPHMNIAPHMNPAFFHNSGSGISPAGPGVPPFNSPGGVSGPQIGSYLPPPMEHRSSPQMSENEFEEVMSRNRTVSSSAITRAVSDASTGEFASAIETLVTAISLIKQSKVAHDDRCKILISSLQDTLHGVETNSYGSSRRERSRSRDRHRRSRRERTRSPERYKERSRDRYYEYPRERSRSRDREYRGRPRGDTTSRTAYYDDRYGERDRERGRERVPRPELPERTRERERERELDRP